MMKTLMIKTHEVWLEMLMAGFMSHTESKQALIDFSDILFRHFTWLEEEVIKAKEPYSYDRDMIAIRVDTLGVLLQDIIHRLDAIELQLLSLKNRALAQRMESDFHYMKEQLRHMEDERVVAFNMKREYPKIALNDEARDALTLFLFEETYKEYELILIYNYLKAHSSDGYMNRIYQILIDESFFHLKQFGQMSAKMGILAVPRIVMRELYEIEDMVTFLKEGIDEELAAKEECIKLAEAVGTQSPELKRFFDFINAQENYHIALMHDALKHYEEKHSESK